MSESRELSSHSSGTSVNYTTGSALAPAGSPLLRLGGGLGIAASLIGIAIFLAACAGLNKSVAFSLVPVILGSAGFVLTLVGAFVQKHLITEDTHVLAAFFPCILGIVGGLLEMAVWCEWHIYAR